MLKNINLNRIKKGLEDEFNNKRLNRMMSKNKLSINDNTNTNSAYNIRSKSQCDSASYILEKKKKLRDLEKTIIEEQGITFKPKINNNIRVGSNYLHRNAEHMRRVEEKLKNLSAFDDYECTFTPNINNSNLNNLNNNSRKRFNSADYNSENIEGLNSISNEVNRKANCGEEAGSRLYEYSKIYLQKKLMLQDSFVEYHTFKPNINKNTDLILENKRAYLENLKNNFPESEFNDEMLNEYNNEMIADVNNNNEQDNQDNIGINKDEKLMNPDYYLDNLEVDSNNNNNPIINRNNLKNKYSSDMNNNTIKEEVKEFSPPDDDNIQQNYISNYSNNNNQIDFNNFNTFNPKSTASNQSNYNQNNLKINSLTSLNNADSNYEVNSNIRYTSQPYSNRITFQNNNNMNTNNNNQIINNTENYQNNEGNDRVDNENSFNGNERNDNNNHTEKKYFNNNPLYAKPISKRSNIHNKSSNNNLSNIPKSIQNKVSK